MARTLFRAPRRRNISTAVRRIRNGCNGPEEPAAQGTATDPLEFAPAIREAVLSIDNTLTIDMSTLDTRIYNSLARPRFHMLIGGIFAAVALLLAVVGLYGVVAYTVAQRTHEIGVRIALGASSKDIRALVVRNGLAPAVLGVALASRAPWPRLA
jgi:putative ABC transport system permease protein